MKQKRTHTQNYDIHQKKLAEFYKKQSIAMCNFNYETKIDGRNLQKNVHDIIAFTKFYACPSVPINDSVSGRH